MQDAHLTVTPSEVSLFVGTKEVLRWHLRGEETEWALCADERGELDGPAGRRRLALLATLAPELRARLLGAIAPSLVVSYRLGSGEAHGPRLPE